jgi:methionyl-tRNA formyltransferase
MAKPTILLLTTEKHVPCLNPIFHKLQQDAHILLSPEYPNNSLVDHIDVVLSFCYPQRIKEPFLTGLKLGAINLHPAPLPNYRGFAIYNFCILNCERSWGVTAHYMDRGFDTGDIIDRMDFPIDSTTATAQSLRDITHKHLYQLFERVVQALSTGRKLPAKRQGSGRYYSRRMMEEYRKINEEDSVEIISRKIRAFWCPPYPGAYIVKDGREFTLVTDEILRNLGENNG